MIPSNRATSLRKTKNQTAQSLRGGFHRLALSFPVATLDLSTDPWREHKIQVRRGVTSEAAETRLDVGVGMGAYFSVVRGKRGFYAKFEFTPAVAMGAQDPCFLASLEDVKELAGEAWVSAERIVDPLVSLEEARVKRIDYARDFQVADPAFWIRALTPVPRLFARKNLVYFSPANGVAETLSAGSKSGTVNLYDKHAEQVARKSPLASSVEQGTLRWEMQAYSEWLNRFGIHAWGDVTTDSLAELVIYRWEWSGMGKEIASASAVVQKVRSAGLSPAQERSLLGYLLLLSMNQASPLSSSTEAHFKRLIRGLNIMVGPDLFLSTFCGRLDFESGAEVHRVA